jgi:hypothetical protein
VATAVRDAMKSGQFKLLNEQTVESMTVFEAIVNTCFCSRAHTSRTASPRRPSGV